MRALHAGGVPVEQRSRLRAGDVCERREAAIPVCLQLQESGEYQDSRWHDETCLSASKVNVERCNWFRAFEKSSHQRIRSVMVRCMRTTLSLDYLKQVVNNALREGLTGLNFRARRKPFRTPSFDLSKCAYPNLDKVWDVLDESIP